MNMLFHERYFSSRIMCIKGFVNRLSHDCQKDIDCRVSTAYSRSSSGDSVDLLSGTICITLVDKNWCIIRPDIIRPGTRLSLLTETLTGTLVQSNRATHIRLHSNNINKDNGIEIPEAWMPTIRQHSSRSLPQRTTEGTGSSSNNANNALDRNPPTMSQVCDAPITNKNGGTNSSTK